MTETNHANCEHARPGETRTSRRAFRLFPLELSLARGTLFTGRQTGAVRKKESDWSDVRGHRGGSVGIVTMLRAGPRSYRGSILYSTKRPYDLWGPTIPLFNSYRGLLPREGA